ncbi:MAG: peptidylprolyl isomerase [Bacteroidales bacterium]|nr:peptidylprolyl isomerase [Bacteroidales bacterium]
MKKLLYSFLALSLAVACQCGNESAGKKEEAGQKADSPESISNEVTEEVAPAVDAEAAATEASALPEEPVFDIVTTQGTIRVRLYKDTPKHRDNFEKLALSGYYDSLLFHRVINDFMIQGGDPLTRDTSRVQEYGTGGPSYTIPAEIRARDGKPLHHHKKGALAAARRGDQANPVKASSGSQFYIVQSEKGCAHLDGEYTVFGETISGLNVIDRIAAQPTDPYNRPLQDVRIITIRPNEEMNKK